jgi:acetyltransferase-like isoleucine patch superfamily enzyme
LKKYLLVFLGVIHLFALAFILDAVFPTINLIPDALVGPTLDFFDALFYRCAPGIFFSLLIVFSTNLFVFIVGYNLCPKHRVEGTLIYMFSFILDLIMVAVALLFSFFGIMFSKEIAISLRFILTVSYVPFFGLLLLFVLGRMVDTSLFFLDILKERKEYGKLRYRIEKNGRLTCVRIDTSGTTVDCILTAAPTLLIEQALFDIRETGPISVFLTNALANFFLYLLTQNTAWPRARLFFFRKLTGAKIGKNCLIGQWTTFDPILPDLIEFEEDCGVGIGCTVLTHSYIGVDRMTFTYGPVKICRYARVGAHCVILPGVTIGEGAIVAAGSVVAEDVPPYTFAAGAQAEIQKRRRKE